MTKKSDNPTDNGISEKEQFSDKHTLEDKQDLINTVVSEPEILVEVLKSEQATKIIMQGYSGPIPPPAYLEHYDSLIPNGADRIMKMAEKEQEGRYSLLNKELGIRKLGSVFGMLSVFLVAGLCGWLIFKGEYKYATIIMCAVLVALAGVFVTGKVIDSKDK